MYLPRHFEQPDPQLLQALVREHPLGALVTVRADGRIDCEHIPFELDPPSAAHPHGVLRAHVARANPVWRESASEALVVFQGPQAYVTPAWYEEKAASGKVVPTWNYAVVHARGPLRAVEDAQWLLGLLERLTDRQEAGRAAPWRVADAPAGYVEKLLAAIVGIEIPLTSLSGKWKASQNKQAADRAAIARGLAEDGEPAMAALVGPALR